MRHRWRYVRKGDTGAVAVSGVGVRAINGTVVPSASQVPLSGAASVACCKGDVGRQMWTATPNSIGNSGVYIAPWLFCHLSGAKFRNRLKPTHHEKSRKKCDGLT